MVAYERTVRQSPSGTWIVEFPDLPGCRAAGPTSTKALANGDAALTAFKKEADEHDLRMPEPGSFKKTSGHFKLRVPRHLHKLLFETASEKKVSLSALTVYLLSVGLTRLQPSFEHPPLKECGREMRNTKHGHCAGVWVQRMSQVLQHGFVWEAKKQGVSVNFMMASTIAYELGRMTH